MFTLVDMLSMNHWLAQLVRENNGQFLAPQNTGKNLDDYAYYAAAGLVILAVLVLLLKRRHKRHHRSRS